MTTIIKKMIKDNAYFYAVKSARVNGKPRIVSQVYLGTADSIVEMKKQCESLPGRVRELFNRHSKSQ